MGNLDFFQKSFITSTTDIVARLFVGELYAVGWGEGPRGLVTGGFKIRFSNVEVGIGCWGKYDKEIEKIRTLTLPMFKLYVLTQQQHVKQFFIQWRQTTPECLVMTKTGNVSM